MKGNWLTIAWLVIVLAQACSLTSFTLTNLRLRRANGTLSSEMLHLEERVRMLERHLQMATTPSSVYTVPTNAPADDAQGPQVWLSALEDIDNHHWSDKARETINDVADALDLT